MGYPTQHYVHGRRIDEIVVKVNGGTKTYYHYDSLGSVVQLTDANANVVEQYEYTAFGKVKIRDGSGNLLTSSQRENRFMFTGRESFLEYEFYYYRNRIYNPELGRFMQTDPIRFRAGDVNIYRYCGNRPTAFVDPLGLAYGGTTNFSGTSSPFNGPASGFYGLREDSPYAYDGRSELLPYEPGFESVAAHWQLQIHHISATYRSNPVVAFIDRNFGVLGDAANIGAMHLKKKPC